MSRERRIRNGQAYDEFGDLLGEALAHEPKPPSTLYHYTNAAGLDGILRSGRIWATHHDFMNDPAEVRVGTNSIQKVLKQATCEIGRLASKAMDGPAGSWEKSRFKDAYLASFSKDGDSLSQWLMYGDGGRGFAIGFDLRDQPCRRVLYLEKEFNELTQTLIARAQTIYEAVAERYQLKDDDSFKVQCATQLLSILEWSCRYKNKKWRHEKEWRVRADQEVFSDSEPVHVRVRGSQLVPYVPIDLWNPADPDPLKEGALMPPEVPICEIVLGPLQGTSGRFAAQSLWMSLGLQRKYQEHEDDDVNYVSIRKSTIEYRQV